MLLERIPAGIYAVNCYVLTCENTGKTSIIDPGGDAGKIIEYLDRNKLELSFILLTHAHGDHIGGIPEIKNTYNVPVYLHEKDAAMLQDSTRNLTRLMGGPTVEINGDRLLKDGDVLELGDLKLEIIHTPGHTPGSISINVEDILLTGDTLFANSIGRTDLEGGSFEQIIDSIKRKLLNFDDSTKVLPGHGAMSTIGRERISNPFLKR